jgi:hypothetical protein
MTQQVGTLQRGTIGLTPKEDPLTYGDINSCQLHLHDCTRLPFRKALVLVANTAWSNAMHSMRPHQCLTELGLTEEWWEDVKSAVWTDTHNLYA